MSKSFFSLVLFILMLFSISGGNEGSIVDSLLRKARDLRTSGRAREAVEISRRALLLSRKAGDRKREAEATLSLAESYYDLSSEEPVLRQRAIFYYEKCLRLIKNKNHGMASYALNSIGILQRRQGRYYQALKTLSMALEEARKIKDEEVRRKRLSAANFNTAYLFHDIGIFGRALKYYRISLEEEKALSRKEEIARVMGNMALIYRRSGKSSMAFYYTQSALKFAREADDRYQQTLFLNNLAYLYLKKGDFRKSLLLHKEALQLASRENYRDLLPYIHSGLGELYYQTGDYSSSLFHLLKALKMDPHDDPDLERPLYRTLTSTYIALGQMEKAAEYFEKYRKFMEERYSPEFFARLEDLLTVLEERERKAEIQLLSIEKERRGLVIKLFVLGTIVLLVLLLWIFIRYRTKKKMSEYLDQVSRHDPLTGLSNRRDVLERLQLERERALRSGISFVVAMGDIDDFKKINDTYGHRGGDIVLKGIADILRENLRMEDIVGRWGGEEFIVVLVGTALSGAIQALEKIRKLVEGAVFEYKNRRIKATLTFGLIQFSPELSLEECINLADEALYLGKARGKNCVVASPSL